MILVFDCETTGLPRNYDAPLDDFDNWPRAVQVAWATYSNTGEKLESWTFYVKPDGWTIPPEATQKHGITDEICREHGKEIDFILRLLSWHVLDSDAIVAHNISFDTAILGSEFLRLGLDNPLPEREQVCTMKASTEYCALGNGRDGRYKWPKLSELYDILFPGQVIKNEHNAVADVQACAKCFFELVRRGVISIHDQQLFTLPAGNDIQKLAYVRHELEGLKMAQKAMVELVTQLPTYQQNERLIAEMKQLQDNLEGKLRAEGVEKYLQDQNKKPGGGYQIKIFKVVREVNPSKTHDWCLRNFTPALKVDYKIFEKVAVSGSIPVEIATVVEEPRVQIDQDLSAFLVVDSPEKAKPEDEIPF